MVAFMGNDKTKETDLTQLLNNCTSSDPSDREKGWKLFMVLYKGHLYRAAKKRCMKSNNTRIKANLQHEADDIVAKVLKKLMDKNFQLLRQYNTIEMASLFGYYLSTITDHVAIRHLQRYYKDNIIRFDPSERPDLGENTNIENEWEWYDEIVFLLRRILKKHTPKNEQKIHMYMMYYRGDMPVEVLLDHKFYKIMGSDAFYTSMNRISNKLKKKV